MDTEARDVVDMDTDTTTFTSAWDGMKLVLPNTLTLNLAEAMASASFAIPAGFSVLLYADFDGIDAQVSSTTWPAVAKGPFTVRLAAQPAKAWGSDTITLNIKRMTGKSFKVTAFKSDAVHELKDRIEMVTEIMPHIQRLIWKGKSLLDHHSLKSIGLRDGDTVHVIRVQNNAQRLGVVDASNNRIVLKITRLACRSKTVSINARTSDTVQQLKESIKQATGIAAYIQRAIWHGNMFYDGHTLGQIGIQSGDIVLLMFDLETREPVELRDPALSFQMFVKGLSGKTETYPVYGSDTVHQLKVAIHQRTGVPHDISRLIFAGKHLEDHRDLSSYGISKEATVHLVLSLCGGKPVIYLFPTSILPSATVRLTLVPSWTFSALYPVVKPDTSILGGDSTVVWNVSATPDGSLVDLASGEELAYLFWEAHTIDLQISDLSDPSHHSKRSVSSGPRNDLAFDPRRPSLTPDNAILLPLSTLLPYLSKILKSLTLHTSARNDFITYWLPSFIRLDTRGMLIAMRFVPQVEYAQAAKVEVEPRPDVVTRIFMLFGGVKGSNREEWVDAEARVATIDWGTAIGLKPEATDQTLFRVLEWGGMEVLNF
ncbi:hypothetical protein RQP46_003622 [Phenoliferia psychrophenolica]